MHLTHPEISLVLALKYPITPLYWVIVSFEKVLILIIGDSKAKPQMDTSESQEGEQCWL